MEIFLFIYAVTYKLEGEKSIFYVNIIKFRAFRTQRIFFYGCVSRVLFFVTPLAKLNQMHPIVFARKERTNRCRPNWTGGGGLTHQRIGKKSSRHSLDSPHQSPIGPSPVHSLPLPTRRIQQLAYPSSMFSLTAHNSSPFFIFIFCQFTCSKTYHEFSYEG